MPLRVFVTTFRTFPYKHWTLNVQHPTESGRFECFQIGGAAHKFSYDTRVVRNPETTRRWAESIELGQISEEQLERMRELAEKEAMNNEDKDWHCQRWTLALVKRLRDEGVIQPTEENMERLQGLYERYPSAWDWACLAYDFNRVLAINAFETARDYFMKSKDSPEEAVSADS
ncbi:Hypothetical predicted protein [Lecanosticta acicola]|uniref:Uncharacterized protein n=1 Tax=Lecanosticta acicola TaxID=111012 RepID=A0AAI8YZC8_9PEZI|nr:Hypothetical predicted protein [Lecanosticta acicola]